MAGYGIASRNDFTGIAISKLDPRTPYGASEGFLKVRLCASPEGDQWAVVNCQDRGGWIDPAFVSFLTSAITKQAATSSGVNWTWVRSDLAKQVAARGYRMADKTTTLTDYRQAVRSWRGRKLLLGEVDLRHVGGRSL